MLRLGSLVLDSPNNMYTQVPPPIGTAQSSTFIPLPTLTSSGGAVDASRCVENGTGSTVLGGYIVTILGIIVGGIATMGLALLALIIAPIADYFNRKKTMALLRGSGIEVGPHQLPELYACAISYAQRLGLKAPPEIFIIEGNVMNAAAMKIGGRKVIVLIDDVVDACLRSGDPQTLAFILGHEMAHHALGHTGFLRSIVKQYFKKLSRLDEFSADAVANELVGNPQVSARALTTLVSGPQLLPYVNLAQLRTQALDVGSDKNAIKAERRLTHPLILRRIQRFL
jgi:Zn-dependent protease with chaperone function